MILERLRKIGVEPAPGTVLGIYGLSMTGKSVLAARLARELAGDKPVNIVATEPHYMDQRYTAMIKKHVGTPTYIHVCSDTGSVFTALRRIRGTAPEGSAIILDSMSYIMMREQSELISRGVTEPRVIAARVVPLIYSVAAILKSIVSEKRLYGAVIMHASSTAGTGMYRDTVPYKPSMAQRVLHSLDYLLYLSLDKNTQCLTLVASRYTGPGSAGATICLADNNAGEKHGKR